VYLCDASAWISIGSSASIPYATTTSPGKVQLAGDIGGAWNNVTINNDAITSAKIAANTILAADIAANAITGSELAGNAVTSGHITNGTITSADIATDTITAGNLAVNSVGDSELIDVPTVTQLNVASGNDNGIRFW